MQAADESIGIIFAYTGRISTNKILKKSSIPMFQEMKAVMQLIKPLMRRRGLARMRAVAAVILINSSSEIGHGCRSASVN